MLLSAVLQHIVRGQAQHQHFALLVEAAQLHGLIQGGNAEVLDAVLHHVFHHDDGAVAVAVGLDDGHGLHIGADLVPAPVDVILQIVQIDLRTGRTQMFHRYNSFIFLKLKKYRFPIVYHTPFFDRMKEETEKILNNLESFFIL